MAGRRGALVGDDVVILHPGEVVVSLVIFPNVIVAELEILPFAATPFGRAMATRVLAALPFATGLFTRLLDRFSFRADTDAIEIFGVQFHYGIMVAVKVRGKDKRRRIVPVTRDTKPRAAGADMTVRERITERLTEAFQPASLDVVDESHLHKGHAGHRPEGESHFRVRISAEAFRGKSRVAIHRMVYEALKAEIDGGVHALAINASVPAAND